MSVEQKLQSFPLFMDFDASEVAAVGRFARVHSASAGQVLLRMGQVNTGIHLIVSGAVKVTRVGTEAELNLATLGAGQAFGEVSFIDGSQATATVTATSPTELIEISREGVDALRAESPRAYGTFWRNIALQLRRQLARSTDVVDHLTDQNQILRDPALRDYYSQT